MYFEADYCGPVWVRGRQSSFKAHRRSIRDGTARSFPDSLVTLESIMENLSWLIVAIGALVGGPIMMFGYRKIDRKLLAFGQIHGVLRQDWTRTGNIDFHTVELQPSSPQPLRLLVEEKRVTESAVGQDITELRWRLATLEEGKELVVCWNIKQT
jgi:hypothetical protein